jgi:hypothetical protein
MLNRVLFNIDLQKHYQTFLDYSELIHTFAV